MEEEVDSLEMGYRADRDWGMKTDKHVKMIEESGQDQREYERRKLFLKNTIWRRNNNDNNIKNNKFQQGPIRQ